MDNQRPTDKPYSPRKYQDNRNQDNRHKDNSGFRYNKDSNNQPPNRSGNERFQPRTGGGYQPREGGSEQSQNRDNRNTFQPRAGQENRDYRDNRNRDSRDNRGGQTNYRANPGNKFQPRPGGKFQPRGKFQAAGKKVPAWKKEDDIKIVSEKQITDGKHKGKYLKNSVSPKASITNRRIREAVFKILSRKVRAGRVLDLCAGSGTVGIEAISRGAITVTFVEKSAKMCAFIKENLKDLAIKEGHGNVVEIEAAPFLIQVAKRKRTWDIVYLDAPADKGYDEIFSILSRGVALALKGVLAIEHPSEVFLPEKSGVLRRWRVVTQGDRAISFFERI